MKNKQFILFLSFSLTRSFDILSITRNDFSPISYYSTFYSFVVVHSTYSLTGTRFIQTSYFYQDCCKMTFQDQQSDHIGQYTGDKYELLVCELTGELTLLNVQNMNCISTKRITILIFDNARLSLIWFAIKMMCSRRMLGMLFEQTTLASFKCFQGVDVLIIVKCTYLLSFNLFLTLTLTDLGFTSFGIIGNLQFKFLCIKMIEYHPQKNFLSLTGLCRYFSPRSSHFLYNCLIVPTDFSAKIKLLAQYTLLILRSIHLLLKRETDLKCIVNYYYYLAAQVSPVPGNNRLDTTNNCKCTSVWQCTDFNKVKITINYKKTMFIFLQVLNIRPLDPTV